MYGDDKVKLAVLLILGFFASYSFKFTYDAGLASQITTVISIFFGFYVASLASIASLPVYEVLKEEEDKRGDRRLSDTFRQYYSFGFFILLMTLSIFILLSAFGVSESVSYEAFKWCRGFDFKLLISALSTSLLLASIGHSFMLTRLFLVLFKNNTVCNKG